MEPDFSKMNGLITAILQDYKTKEVLMVGYMNEEAYQKTLEDKVVWFYSRSKKRLWKKGESSGHIQKVVDIKLDCDQDAALLLVEPLGPTCHLMSQSCFGDGFFNLSILDQTVNKKINQPEEGSYTAYLVKEGLDKILKKNGEEMTELVIASKNNDPEEVISEASDLLYHILVLLNYMDISLSDVELELKSRHGQKQEYSIRKEISQW